MPEPNKPKSEFSTPPPAGMTFLRGWQLPSVARRIAWSPDGSTLAVPMDTFSSEQPGSPCLLWPLESPVSSFVQRTPDDGMNSLSVAAWSPDGQQVAVGGDGSSIHVYHAANGVRDIRLEESSGWLISLAWSPHEKLLASGSWNGTIQLWDMETHQVRKWFAAHSGGVNMLAWSPDGLRLASASADRTLRISSTDGTCLATLRGHYTAFQALAAGRDPARFRFPRGHHPHLGRGR